MTHPIKSKQSDLEHKFRKVLPHKNFMTPTVMSFRQKGDYIIELSKGEGINGRDLFGVTVVNMHTKEHEHEMSTCFQSYEACNEYINNSL